jgi:phage protein U
MLLMFGPVTMDVLVVRGLEISDGWGYAEHAVIEGKPKLQFTGPRLREVSLQFRLRRDWGDPEAMLGQLRALADAGTAGLLQRGDGRLIGLFVLTSLSDRPRWAVSSGRPVDIEASAQLKEYVPEDARPAAIAVTGAALARRG